MHSGQIPRNNNLIQVLNIIYTMKRTSLLCRGKRQFKSTLIDIQHQNDQEDTSKLLDPN